MGRKLTKKEKKLFANRNRKIKDIMRKLSKAIISYALTKNIDAIVIGHNQGWKQTLGEQTTRTSFRRLSTR